MRSLLAAALGLVAVAVPTASTTPRIETLYSRPGGTIAAFAQDGPLIAWFEPSRTRCNQVRVLSLANGLMDQLPRQGAARNVTCRWHVVPPVGLAIARKYPDVLWTLREEGPLSFDFVIGAGAGDRRERRFHELAHTSRGAGLWLGGIAGDGSTLVYGATSVDYEDEAGCLAGSAPCDMKITGGGVFRVVGRQEPKPVPGTGGTVAIAVSGANVAYVPAAPVGKKVVLAADADMPISVVDVNTGDVIARVWPQGVPTAIALTDTSLVTLERLSSGMRLAWYETATGKTVGVTPAPDDASPEVSANNRFAIYHVGRVIHAVDLQTQKDRVVAKAAASPIGLSLEGTRLAWAENLPSGGRIRALTLVAKSS